MSAGCEGGPPQSPEEVARAVETIGRISAVPALLKLLCEHTGMGFAAVAHVTEGSWTACAVEDRIQFGLLPGSQLAIENTLCTEVRAARRALLVDRFSLDEGYRNHHVPRMFGIESYVSVPIVLSGDVYFGNLCAVDPRPAQVSDARTRAMFEDYAQLIARLLEGEEHSQAAEQALQQAEEHARLREEFIAVLGHDLRNPLTAIVHMADVLMLRQGEPRAAESGVLIRRSAKRMWGMIDDVLDFARGRLGSGLDVDAHRVEDLGEALNQVVAEMREAHPEREIATSIHIPVPVSCDRGRVQQILSNLLGNALTHGAEEMPIVVAAAVDGDQVEILVMNGGAPIAPHCLPHLFEPYWRSPDSRSGGGLGLGLHICSKIVQAHGGTITVESSLARGTCFRVRLPISGPSPAA